MNKIAILTDSCTDVPKEYIDKYNIYVVPLSINYTDKTYYDGVDITTQEICDNFEKEIPKTSLPTGDTIIETLEQIKQDGYEKVIAITISSGLSGTYSMIHMIAQDFEGLDVQVIDTKNIGIGSGLHVIRAAELLEAGKSFEEVCDDIQNNIKNCKLFFCVKTLEYLRKGGRIGLVASMLGSVLDLKPIISCNDDGVYYTVTKTRGRMQSIKKAAELALRYAKDSIKYNVAIVHCGAEEEAKFIKEEVLKTFKNVNVIIEGVLGPALVVHTGPGLIGLGVYKLS